MVRKAKEEKPKVISVIEEIELTGKELHLKVADGDDDTPVVYVVEPDPGVTETITCTSMVCSHQILHRGDEVINPNPMRVQFVLAPDVRLAKDVRVKFKSTK